MNVGGHIAVARTLSDDPRFWLGAALPDLGSFGGFRLVGSTPNEVVAAGIRCHHQTDDAFHRSEWFRSRQDRLRARLGADGLARGSARAVAHVGPELLIDGALLRDETIAADVTKTFRAISDSHTRSELGELVPERSNDWLDHLDNVADRSAPTDYDDPVAVAKRLYRILLRRPRLAMPERHIDIAAAALADEHDSIRSTAGDLVQELSATVGG